MRLQSRSLARDGIEYAGDTVRDVVPDNMPNKKRCKIDTDDGKYKVEPVEGGHLEAFCQNGLYLVDERMKDIGSHGGEDAYHECQYNRHLLVGQMGFLPCHYFSKQSVVFYGLLLIILYV